MNPITASATRPSNPGAENSTSGESLAATASRSSIVADMSRAIRGSPDQGAVSLVSLRCVRADSTVARDGALAGVCRGHGRTKFAESVTQVQAEVDVALAAALRSFSGSVAVGTGEDPDA